MSEPGSTQTRPRRGRLAISLRLLIGVVLVSGVVLGWKAKQARDQRRAVAAVLSTGGEVLYDWQEPITNRTPAPGSKPWAPKWLRRLVGDEHFQEVVSVHVGGRGEVPLDVLKAIGRLPNVRHLNVGMLRIGPEEAECLSGMTSLRSLVLGNSRATDEALERLSNLTNLEELYAHWTQVRVGTKSLARMKKLREITLSHCKLTDEGLEYLIPLPSLKSITIHDNPLSDDSVRRFMARRPDVTVEYQFPDRTAGSRAR